MGGIQAIYGGEMSPEEWLASQTQAAPTPAPARAQVTDQASKDKEVVQILMQEFKTAQTKSQSGDQRAQEDVKSIARELARKGVTVDLAPAAAPVSATPAPTPAAALMSPEQWAASQPKMGFFESLAEQVTGSKRSASPEVAAALAEKRTIYDMPEANQMSFGLLKSALGGLMAGSEERAKIFAANFPGLTYRLDQQGTVFMRSPTDGKEYVIEPGLTAQDVPRVGAAIAAFTPAGRAATIPSAIAGAGATQAVIEASQAATGGEFSPKEVALAAATGPVGQVLQRVVPPAVQAVKGGLQRMTGPGRAPSTPAAPGAPMGTAPAPRVEPTFEAPPAAPAAMAPEAPAAPPMAAATPEAPPPAPGPAGAPMGTAMAPEVPPAAPGAAVPAGDVGEVLNLARKAGGMGPGSTAAKAKLVDMAQVNPEARAAAERLGIDVPFDVLSDNPQVRSAVGLTRALVAGEAEAAWENTVRQSIQRADEISQQFDAAFIEGRPAPGLTSQKIVDSLTATRTKVIEDAQNLYNQVQDVVLKETPVNVDSLKKTISDIRRDYPGSSKNNPAIEKLEKLAEEGMTYGDLSFEKSFLGAAKRAGTDNVYSKSLNLGIIKQLEGALAKDQLDNVERLAGEETRRQLRAAHLLTAKQKALEERIIGAFGKEIDGSVAQRMQTAISTAAKGDAAAFNRLMKVVPKELQKETLATALASVTAGKAAGRAAAGSVETVFSPAEFTRVYRGLRSNPPVYSQMVKIMGPEWDRTSRDLYEISRRIADAQARIPTTGKANQILGDAAVESLFGKIMSSSLAQRAATGVASMVPGGGLIAPDIVGFMAGAKGAGVQKAAKLFASPEFQELAVQSATKGGEPTQAAIRRTAMSKSFSDFSKEASLPQSLDARVQYLQSAIQAGRQSTQENE